MGLPALSNQLSFTKQAGMAMHFCVFCFILCAHLSPASHQLASVATAVQEALNLGSQTSSSFAIFFQVVKSLSFPGKF